ncbi:MAG TPA: molybdopterin-dependent oxidoreductase, partial [Micromonosporaceae bacterium]
WLAFGTGTLWPARVVTVTHAILGIAMLALVPWKQLIARRGLGRPGGGSRGVAIKASSVLLALSVVVSLIAGFAHSYAGPRTYFGVTAMQVHVGAAIVAALMFVVHVVTRPQRVRATDLSRRNVFRLVGLVAVAGLSYAAVEGLASVARLPGRRRRATGSYETGTDDPAAMPLTSWLFDTIPSIEPGAYTLRVRDGGGARTVGYDELADGTDTVRAVLDCTGGWYAAQDWRGVRLDRLLPDIPAGHVIEVMSTTGYRRRFPAGEASSLWLATHMAGVPLDAGHGAPVRLVAPDRRGFWWVKWVASIDAVAGEDWWQSPFPLQ